LPWSEKRNMKADKNFLRQEILLQSCQVQLNLALVMLSKTDDVVTSDVKTIRFILNFYT